MSGPEGQGGDGGQGGWLTSTAGVASPPAGGTSRSFRDVPGLRSLLLELPVAHVMTIIAADHLSLVIFDLFLALINPEASFGL